MIRIYDGNNYFRRLMERSASAQRDMFTEMCHTTDPVIWVWDGAKGNERRRARYPAYKMNRPPLAKSLFEGFKLQRELLKHTPVLQITVPEYEADDVVATLALACGRRDQQVGIFSNDYDFAQLSHVFPNSIFCGAEPKADVSSEHVRLYKTCVGDVSDNISGIRGFGKKGWEKADKSALLAYVLQESEAHGFEGQSARTWADANRELIKTMWDIVGFYDVPADLIDQHTTAGKKDYAAGNLLLERFFL